MGGQVQRALQERVPGQTIDIRRMEAVGAQMSTELRHQATFALLYAMLGMTIYISGRFEAKWLAALGLAAGLFVVTSTVSSWLPGLSPVVVVVAALVALIALQRHL